MSDFNPAYWYVLGYVLFGGAYAIGAMRARDGAFFATIGPIRVAFWPLFLMYDLARHLNKDPL